MSDSASRLGGLAALMIVLLALHQSSGSWAAPWQDSLHQTVPTRTPQGPTATTEPPPTSSPEYLTVTQPPPTPVPVRPTATRPTFTSIPIQPTATQTPPMTRQVKHTPTLSQSERTATSTPSPSPTEITPVAAHTLVATTTVSSMATATSAPTSRPGMTLPPSATATLSAASAVTGTGASTPELTAAVAHPSSTLTDQKLHKEPSPASATVPSPTAAPAPARTLSPPWTAALGALLLSGGVVLFLVARSLGRTQ